MLIVYSSSTALKQGSIAQYKASALPGCLACAVLVAPLREGSFEPGGRGCDSLHLILKTALPHEGVPAVLLPACCYTNTPHTAHVSTSMSRLRGDDELLDLLDIMGGHHGDEKQAAGLDCSNSRCVSSFFSFPDAYPWSTKILTVPCASRLPRHTCPLVRIGTAVLHHRGESFSHEPFPRASV